LPVRLVWHSAFTSLGHFGILQNWRPCRGVPNATIAERAA